MASHSRRARSLRTRPHKTITMIMVGFLTTEATIKIKHFTKGVLSNGGNTCFCRRQLVGKQLLHGEKGRKLQNLTLSPLLDGPFLGGSLGARSATQMRLFAFYANQSSELNFSIFPGKIGWGQTCNNQCAKSICPVIFLLFFLLFCSPWAKTLCFLKGKVLGEKFWKSVKKCEKVWTIMKRFCPLVVAL